MKSSHRINEIHNSLMKGQDVSFTTLGALHDLSARVEAITRYLDEQEEVKQKV